MHSKSQIVELGRGSIEYEYVPVGEAESSPAVTVFLHHGLIGGAGVLESSRLAARNQNVALVTVSRPGYGATDSISMGSIGEWAGILSSLADHLEIARFAVGGFSAGAPYAYACGALLPDRVSCVAIGSGLPFLHDDVVFSAYPRASQEAFRRFSAAMIEQVRAEITALIAKWTSTTEPSDPLYRFVRATLSSNGIGPGREVWLQMQPWGFDLGEIRQPVRLWHHPQDPQVPFACAERMGDLLVDAHLEILDGTQTHGPTPESFERMLAWVVAHART